MKNRKASQFRFPGRISDYSANPPTEPYVRLSLIRFLGVARFHTTRLQPTPQSASHVSIRSVKHVFASDASTHRNVPSLYPRLHDLGTGQSVLCHHPTKRLPSHLAATATVQPITPGTLRRVVHQVQAFAVAANAIVLVVATQLRAQDSVLVVQRLMPVILAPLPKRRPRTP